MAYILVDIFLILLLHVFPHDSVGKESTCNAGDTGDRLILPYRRAHWTGSTSAMHSADP